MNPPVDAPTSAQSRSGDVDAERVERVLQLLATARDEARRTLDLERDILGNLLARFVVPGNEPREHERLRLRARLREPTLDEEHVEALLRHAGAQQALRRPELECDEQDERPGDETCEENRHGDNDDGASGDGDRRAPTSRAP